MYFTKSSIKLKLMSEIIAKAQINKIKFKQIINTTSIESLNVESVLIALFLFKI